MRGREDLEHEYRPRTTTGYSTISLALIFERRNLTVPLQHRWYDRMEKFLVRLKAISHHILITSFVRLPAGTITTGHSSPLAAWHVDIVNFYGRDEKTSSQGKKVKHQPPLSYHHYHPRTTT